MSDTSFGFMLFQGRDDKPQLFCGFYGVASVFGNLQGLPIFASYKDEENARMDPCPMMFWYKSDALETWKKLEAMGYKVELLQICSGYTQFER